MRHLKRYLDYKLNESEDFYAPSQFDMIDWETLYDILKSNTEGETRYTIDYITKCDGNSPCIMSSSALFDLKEDGIIAYENENDATLVSDVTNVSSVPVFNVDNYNDLPSFDEFYMQVKEAFDSFTDDVSGQPENPYLRNDYDENPHYTGEGPASEEEDLW
jgi:hypothetical protein